MDFQVSWALCGKASPAFWQHSTLGLFHGEIWRAECGDWGGTYIFPKHEDCHRVSIWFPSWFSKPAFQVGVFPRRRGIFLSPTNRSCFALSQEIVPGSSGGLFKVPALGFDHSCRSLTPLGGFLSAGLKHIEAYKFSEMQIALGKYSMYSPSRWLNACDIMWLSKLNVGWM